MRDSVGGEGGWVGAGEGAVEGGAEGFVGFWGLVRIGLVEGWTLGGSYVVLRMGGRGYEMTVLTDSGWVEASLWLVTALVQVSNALRKVVVGRCGRSVAYKRVQHWTSSHPVLSRLRKKSS